MAIPIGRQGQVYVVKETSYGTVPTMSASDAVRHIEVGFGFDPFSRQTSPEKKQSPGAATRFNRKKSAELATLVALLRPSGTINTKPEADRLLECAFGAVRNETRFTTVKATPAPTTTGCDATNAGDYSIGSGLLIQTGGAKYLRVITNIVGESITWTPALPAPPIDGDSLNGMVTYKLATDLTKSLSVSHYLSTLERKLQGVAINTLGLNFQPNEEGRLTVAGPAQLQTTPPTKPSGFTSVGGNPPSGLVGNVLIDGTAYLFKTLELAMTNNAVLRNQEFGVNNATAMYRSGRREISLSLEAFADDAATIYNKALAGTDCELLLQTGDVVGNMIGAYCPRVEFKVPETDDPDEEVSWTYAAMALETVDGANDELTLMFA